MFLFRLFDQAGAPWEGETHALKTTLTEATEIWERLMGEDVPCPVAFKPEDLLKTKELSTKLQVADELCAVTFDETRRVALIGGGVARQAGSGATA